MKAAPQVRAAPNPLKGFSDEQLLEEICRRQRVRLERDERVAFVPCEDCANFIFWTKDCDPPKDYQPCRKGHQMKFRMPEDYNDTDCGHYRRVCEDRAARAGEPA